VPQPTMLPRVKNFNFIELIKDVSMWSMTEIDKIS
jgi:hypothetical protein